MRKEMTVVEKTRVIKGRLIFFDLETITIMNENGTPDLDLAILLKNFLIENNGKPAVLDHQADNLTLKIKEKSETILFWREFGNTTLEIECSFSGINFSAYASDLFESLNAQLVTVKLSPDSFEISFDPVEDVPGVYYGGSGNMCPIKNEDIKTICGIGTGSDTCIFITSGSQGFECGKFDSSIARAVLARLKEGTMTVQRIGNCRCLGRK